MKPLASGRLELRPLEAPDFEVWYEARSRNVEWLRPWEPVPEPGAAETSRDRAAFRSRCVNWARQRHLDAAYAFGVFDEDSTLVGEIHLSNVLRGPFQSAMVGYWIDQARAGRGIAPEALVLVLRFAFEELRLHRIEVCVVPRNKASRRVAEKLRLREEGVAVGFLQVHGVWEDHIRYAVTAEDWAADGADLVAAHVTGPGPAR